MISITFRSGQKRNFQVSNKNEYYLVNWRATSNPQIWHPPTDVYERSDSIEVRVEIAGMTEDDFAISLDKNTLVISGVRQDASERRTYHQMEIYFGEFLSVVEIHAPIDAEQVRAEYQNGFLYVILPKTQPKTIEVKEIE